MFVPVRKNHKVLHGFQLILKVFEQRDEHGVNKQALIFGVIDDVANLFCEKTRINRMTNISGTRDSVVELEVAVVIPRQRSNAIVR